MKNGKNASETGHYPPHQTEDKLGWHDVTYAISGAQKTFVPRRQELVRRANDAWIVTQSSKRIDDKLNRWLGTPPTNVRQAGSERQRRRRRVSNPITSRHSLCLPRPYYKLTGSPNQRQVSGSPPPKRSDKRHQPRLLSVQALISIQSPHCLRRPLTPQRVLRSAGCDM